MFKCRFDFYGRYREIAAARRCKRVPLFQIENHLSGALADAKNYVKSRSRARNLYQFYSVLFALLDF